jgi:transposase-like protein
MAVERLKTCDNIVALSKELGVRRQLLYKWRDQFAPFDEQGEPATGSSQQATLRRKVHQLRRVLVDKTLEVETWLEIAATALPARSSECSGLSRRLSTPQAVGQSNFPAWGCLLRRHSSAANA